MTDLQRKMRRLEEQIQRKLQLEDQLSLWNTQIAALAPQVRQLQVIMDQEQDDVDRLERPGLSSVIHTLLGTKAEQLDKEQQEADEAIENFTCASGSLERLLKLVQEAESELAGLDHCQEEYLDILRRQVELTEQTALQMTEQPELAGRRLQLERSRRSLREALLLCLLLLHGLKKNRNSLQTAKALSHDAVSAKACPFIRPGAENTMDLATKLQAKLAQLGIDPQDHLLVGPFFRSPATYLMSSEDSDSRLEDALYQVKLLEKDSREIQTKLTEALTLVENSIKEME